ncbi:endonuclease/exonuclease/phosphatase family protein [Novosphingobium mangrovi (ex Hu et al. 2023)]|uniref:Endonuclease/exonuclease/phosphatase family protein n=1 Tax=Novosphingobium mangrovi (ex Hu et al. 2023) TaxID=2930094 RepID=A0ABT0AHS1_9SPHN|nr:endonuclease/exonuclease/phosphatase family protein [Novosphingobium mangrovi (ex Hu et al. 2023)]MCJ1962723.1 endonuclease/exonuclease/phosphatase family protein [Novosphingobium mangrovi (ex Hu et al. 2023)]
MHAPVDPPTPRTSIGLRLRTWLVRLAVLGLAIAGLVLLLPKLAGHWPYLGLAALIHVPAMWLGLASTLVLLARRVRRAQFSPSRVGLSGVGLLGIALVLVLTLQPVTRIPAPCPSDAPRLTLAWLNARHTQRPQLIRRWLQRARPDVIGLAEMPPWRRGLTEYLDRHYAFMQNCQPKGQCSTRLYTQIPPAETLGLARGDAEQRRTLSGAGLVFPASSGTRDWSIAAVHLSRPTSPQAQARELREFEARMGADADTLILGDFNLSPRLPVLQDFVARNGLTITRADQPTWPLELGERRLKGLWQIDHLLTGRHWRVESFKTSPWLGSDHRGFIAKVCRVD